MTSYPLGLEVQEYDTPLRRELTPLVKTTKYYNDNRLGNQDILLL